ncbi:DNA primase [Hyphomicrobium methylovorum]|uniref:DNA primase n=1 Tax=Hyphomicrobium methylovorum TaxID=84 RepID=UPI0015E77FDA|nr:DNA primase [Hyphomicrobium methylovorum]MBA2124830.1 DNA primase [Hyphomicrobium methylovorum]
MRFSPNLLDEIRARLSVSQVVGRRVALKKAGREFRGLSPFKTEKTPSFYVNDQKGFYHCFASGEHGDIFTFVMKTEGLEFPEAVERLAAEAGVPLPKQTERNVAEEDQRARLYRLLEASAEFFTESLRSGVGSEARRYFEKRGLKRETIQTFRLGFAPNSRSALSAHLKAEGFTPGEMATAGMLIAGEDIAEPYDRFRNRVMFPILDLKGRVVAFGGRALDPQAQAKYLNSPETPLFHKGGMLFNAGRARTAAHTKNRVIVVEGYMDVVSLAEAGFAETVAPLGTALTEDQLKLLWRFAAEPTLCFDGDSAGRKAAERAVDVALPWLKPGFSIAFAFMPQGIDPDDLVRQQGTDAMNAILGATRPLVDVLWDRELKAAPYSTPEQRAALEARLHGLANTIEDRTVRGHYTREIRDRLYHLGRGQRRSEFAPRSPSGERFEASYARPRVAPDWRGRERTRLSEPERRFTKKIPLTDMLNPSPELARQDGKVSAREALILKTLVNHPWLIDDHSEDIAALEFCSTGLSALRDEILAVHAGQNSLDSATLRSQLSKSGVAKVVDLVARTITHISDRFAEPDASATEVEAAWNHVLALHQRQDALERALKAAEEAWFEDCTEEAETRLLDIKRQIAREVAMDQTDNETDQPAEDSPITTRAS